MTMSRRELNDHEKEQGICQKQMGWIRNLPSTHHKARGHDTKNWEQFLSTEMHFYFFIYLPLEEKGSLTGKGSK